jgi:hypothetical protein
MKRYSAVYGDLSRCFTYRTIYKGVSSCSGISGVAFLSYTNKYWRYLERILGRLDTMGMGFCSLAFYIATAS